MGLDLDVAFVAPGRQRRHQEAVGATDIQPAAVAVHRYGQMLTLGAPVADGGVTRTGTPRALTGCEIRVLQQVPSPNVPCIEVTHDAMIAAAADDSAWNSVLHAPTAPAVTQRQMIAAHAEAAGVPAPKVAALPVWMLKAMSPFSTELRELAETSYQFAAPFVMDSTKSERQLGLSPTPLATAAAETVAWWRSCQP